MSKNIFKTNSRFDVLKEEYNNEKKNNESHNKNQLIHKEEKNLNKKIKKTDSLSNQKINLLEVNFPKLTNAIKPQQLITQVKTQEVTQDKIQEKKLNFIDKLNTVKEIILPLKKDDETVSPGWVKLEKNKITKKVTIKYGKKTYISDDEREITPTDVLYNLVMLHEQRKEDYIRDWGEESYEKTFKFINYDYDYFDNLDEEYERNQIEEYYISDEELE
jgi:hypothetical protein